MREEQSSKMSTLSLKEYEDIAIPVPWGHISGRWYGNRQVRPILAIHGWLDNLGTFERLIPLLPAHVGVLCIDLPGHGRSSHYPPGIRYWMQDYVLAIIRVIKEYKWQRVSLMGHSLGAALVFMFTSIYPHMVDSVIAIDIIVPRVYEKGQLPILAHNIEKLIVEDERIGTDPPSSTYAELEQKIYEGSSRSISLENAKYLIERSTKKSELFPDKYYFSRDGRVKYYQTLTTDSGLIAEMARRIKNVPYLIIKGSESTHIDKNSAEAIIILRAQNAHFEYHELKGTHHLHANDAEDCAKVIVPFIHRHRPATLDSWALTENAETTAGHRQAQERFFAWQHKRAHKAKPKSKL